jgi:RND superfamily putative drug exporter
VGVGLVLAVVVDVTVVRMLLPAVMKLMGGRDWWAPAPLRRLHERWPVGTAPLPGPAGVPELVGARSCSRRR